MHAQTQQECIISELQGDLKNILSTFQQTKKKKVLLVSHSLGGGVEQHLEELEQLFSKNALFIRLYSIDYQSAALYLSNGYFWRINWKRGYKQLCALLDIIGIDRIHYHHLANFPLSVYRLGQDLGLPYDVTVHDYFMVNGNPTLLGDWDNFSPHSKTREEAVDELFVPPNGVSLCDWKKHCETLLRQAERVISPSFFAKKVLCEHHSELDSLVGFHPDFELDYPYPPPATPQLKPDTLDVIVVGALNREKGADLLERVAIEASKRSLPIRFMLLGYAYRKLDDVIKEYGGYESNELDSNLTRIGPSLVWFPTRCAETYSYVLSAVLRQGIPLIAPNIGAFPERTAGRPLSWIVDASLSVNDYLDLFLSVQKTLTNHMYKNKVEKWDQCGIEQTSMLSYLKDYLAWEQVARERRRIQDYGLLKEIKIFQNESGSTFKVRVLSTLLGLKSTALMRLLQKKVPYHWQKRIKRALSTKPMHKL